VSLCLVQLRLLAHAFAIFFLQPSIRFNHKNSAGVHVASQLSELGMANAEPVLPLQGTESTLIIADTSGLHCRGLAKSGTRRTALRPMGALNDGGVKRYNPFSASA